MQSIDEIARAIAALDPSEQQDLLEKVSKLNGQNDSHNAMDTRLELMREAVKDEVFLSDLREVMDDFRCVDSEETVA